jgi:hypothetical protein
VYFASTFRVMAGGLMPGALAVATPLTSASHAVSCGAASC